MTPELKAAPTKCRSRLSTRQVKIRIKRWGASTSEYGKGGTRTLRSLLAERLQGEGIAALDREYQRAYASIESDPPSAVTAACAILEVCARPSWNPAGTHCPRNRCWVRCGGKTAKHLNLHPGQLAVDDLRRILQGLNSIAEGVAAIRTHEGSAHGRSGHEDPQKPRYRLLPRHARLAVHAAHTMAMFVLETWDARKWR
jgi:hypothetical protein